MNLSKLIKMANQIGEFFEAMPDRKQALQDIAGHIRRSWDPSMRAELMSHFDEACQAEQGLTPIVREAIRTHRELVG